MKIKKALIEKLATLYNLTDRVPRISTTLVRGIPPVSIFILSKGKKLINMAVRISKFIRTLFIS